MISLASGWHNHRLLSGFTHDGVDELRLTKLTESFHHFLVGILELLILFEQLVLLNEPFSSQGNVVVLFIEQLCCLLILDFLIIELICGLNKHEVGVFLHLVHVGQIFLALAEFLFSFLKFIVCLVELIVCKMLLNDIKLRFTYC